MIISTGLYDKTSIQFFMCVSVAMGGGAVYKKMYITCICLFLTCKALYVVFLYEKQNKV